LRRCQLFAHPVIALFPARFHGTKRMVVLSPANDRVVSFAFVQTIHELFELFSSRVQLRKCLRQRS
jgi:hypothetical protein